MSKNYHSRKPFHNIICFTMNNIQYLGSCLKCARCRESFSRRATLLFSKVSRRISSSFLASSKVVRKWSIVSSLFLSSRYFWLLSLLFSSSSCTTYILLICQTSPFFFYSCFFLFIIHLLACTYCYFYMLYQFSMTIHSYL